MSNIVWLTKENNMVITVGSKCYNCIYLRASKITNNKLVDDVIICGKLNKEIKNTMGCCKYKNEEEVDLKVGDKVKTKSNLKSFTKYKGISYFDYMYLEEEIITEIDVMIIKMYTM